VVCFYFLSIDYILINLYIHPSLNPPEFFSRAELSHVAVTIPKLVDSFQSAEIKQLPNIVEECGINLGPNWWIASAAMRISATVVTGSPPIKVDASDKLGVTKSAMGKSSSLHNKIWKSKKNIIDKIRIYEAIDECWSEWKKVL
jgi:hypothetical protein